MKDLKLLSIVILPIAFLLACTGNATTNKAKDSSGVSATATSGSGDGMYYEINTNTTSSAKDNISIHNVTKFYVSAKGDSRKEININSTYGGKTNSSQVIAIGHIDKPDESILIDDETKTYTVNHIDRSDQNPAEKIQSTVTKIGNEKILGYNCVHAQIMSTKTISSQVDTYDLWKSNEVPMPPAFKEAINKFGIGEQTSMFSPEVTGQLKQMGCEGFTARLELKGKRTSVKSELTRVEHRTIAAGMFEIPAGYTEEKD
jgi:Domain of unknown function (DUF4412)